MTETAVADVVVEIEIDAPREEVFDALTDPAAVMDWWTDEGDGYGCTAFESDVRVGGRWWSEHRPGRGDGPVCVLAGMYTIVERPDRLAFTWVYEKYMESFEGLPTTTVTIDLSETAGVTHMRLTHSGLAGGSKLGEDHRSGWRHALEGIARLFRERSGG